MYIIDANIFIDAGKKFYPNDIFPSFWERLSEPQLLDRTYMIRSVYNELIKGNDEVSFWVDHHMRDKLVEDVNDAVVLKKWAEIIQFVSSSDSYKKQAARTWSKHTVADPWLIAVASINDWTIVTNEQSGNPHPGGQSARAKIPDVCNHFKVHYINHLDWLREIRLII